MGCQRPRLQREGRGPWKTTGLVGPQRKHGRPRLTGEELTTVTSDTMSYREERIRREHRQSLIDNLGEVNGRATMSYAAWKTARDKRIKMHTIA